MGHLILLCLRVLLECICRPQSSKTTLFLRQPGRDVSGMTNVGGQNLKKPRNFQTLLKVLNRPTGLYLFPTVFGVKDCNIVIWQFVGWCCTYDYKTVFI